MSVTVMLGGNVDEIHPALDTAIDFAKRIKTNLTGLCALPDPANSVVYITGAETVIMGRCGDPILGRSAEEIGRGVSGGLCPES